VFRSPPDADGRVPAVTDSAIRDLWWSSTPLGWAQHMNQPSTIALLEPLTPDDAAT